MNPGFAKRRCIERLKGILLRRGQVWIQKGMLMIGTAPLRLTRILHNMVGKSRFPPVHFLTGSRRPNTQSGVDAAPNFIKRAFRRGRACVLELPFLTRCEFWIITRHDGFLLDSRAGKVLAFQNSGCSERVFRMMAGRE